MKKFFEMLAAMNHKIVKYSKGLSKKLSEKYSFFCDALFFPIFNSVKNKLFSLWGRFHELWKLKTIKIAVFYMAVITVFAFIYSYFFYESLCITEERVIEGLYFSIVTITTLGFGDITPQRSDDALLITISLQVLIGIVTIGYFLDTLSRTITEVKKKQVDEEEEKKALAIKIKALTLLKPHIEFCLGNLRKHYLVTSTKYHTINDKLENVFTDEYFNQLSKVDYFSTRSGHSGITIYAQSCQHDNRQFVQRIESYLSKYSSYLELPIIIELENMINSEFLSYPDMAIQGYSHIAALAQDKDRQMNFSESVSNYRHEILWEHGELDMPHRNHMRPFHDSLVTISNEINKYIEHDQLKFKASVQPANMVPPNCMSAVSRYDINRLLNRG